MASNYTENYGLCQWEASDAVERTEFNEDNSKIDAALKSQASSISSLNSKLEEKASTGTVNTLSTQLTHETQNRTAADNMEKAAREAADAALEAVLALKGNCQIYYTTYTGNGEHTKTMTFPGKPLLVIGMGNNYILRAVQGAPIVMCKSSGTGGEPCPGTWSGNSLTWTMESLAYGLNVKGYPYYMVCLMAANE